MNSFLAYLRRYRTVLICLFFFIIFFGLSFYLYDIPAGAVWYPSLVCLSVAAVAAVIHVLKEKQRHSYLQTLMNCIPELPDDLPAETVIEKDYAALLRSLAGYTAEIQSSRDRQYKDLSEYYSIWAHQIKTPIAAMKLTLQNEDSPVSRRLERNLQRIEQYVEMVLTFVRLESDSSDYVINTCSLDDIVRGVIRKFAGEFIDRRLRLEYSGVEMQVLTDSKWLSFVIEQVMSNALKYTPEGSVSIFLDDGSLCIRDTGIGIAPEDLPRIFENGYTGLNGRSDNHATGIGLYLCRRVCNRLNHSISIESKPYEGTTVRITLSRPDCTYD